MTLEGVPQGTNVWRVKGLQSLANSGSLNISGSGITQVEFGLMRTGDANNDNVVNAQDFNILKTTFGKSQGQPGYDARADFNGDNVVRQDVNLLESNFGQGGAPPIRP